MKHAPLFMAFLLPLKWTGCSIIAGQELQIQHVDDPIIVQVCGSGNGCVVAHPDRQGIELIDHIVVDNITGQQSDLRLCADLSGRERDRALCAEETLSGCNHAVRPGRSAEAERAICVGSHRSDQRVFRIVQTDRDRLTSLHLSGERSCHRGGRRRR